MNSFLFRLIFTIFVISSALCVYAMREYCIEKDILVRVKHIVRIDTSSDCEKLVRSDLVFLNNVETKCDCGKNPCIVLIFYGTPHVYCFKCASQIAKQLLK